MTNDISKCVESIFEELVESKLLDIDSRFYAVSKERVIKTCSHIYPLTEFFDYSREKGDFLFFSCILFSYTYYLDESIDSLDNVPKSVCSNQIASFLLIRYTEWLIQHYDTRTLKSFYTYFSEYSKYLIAEKNWEYTEDYCQEYGSIENNIFKAYLCLFPVELVVKNFDNEYAKKIQNLFISYFSFLLLHDDIEDIGDDIQDQCLTYPIAKYYEMTGILPKSKIEIIQRLPTIRIELQKLADSIKEMKIQNGWVLKEIIEEINTSPSYL